MKTQSFAALTIVVFLTTSCHATQKAKPNVAPKAPGVVQPLVAKFSEGCLVPASEVTAIIQQTGLGAALAAALIPKAAGAAVDFVGGLLKTAGEDQKTVMQASAGPYLYRVGPWSNQTKRRAVDHLPNARCLHLLSFRDATEADWGSVVEGTERAPDNMKAVQEGLGMLDHPAPTFYMEFAVVVSDDRGAFKLVPTFLKFGRSFSGRNRASELLSAISFSHPGTEKPFASGVVLLRGLTAGTTYDVDALLGSWSDWMPFDKPSEAATEAQGQPGKADTVEPARLFDPVNVKTVMTETQDGIKILKTLGELISGSKEDVTKALAAALPSEEKQAAAEASRLDDRNAFVNAMADVKVKEAELNAKTDALDKAKAQAELTKAKLAANKAALKAGMLLPYADLYPSGS